MNSLSNLACCQVGNRDWKKADTAINESVAMFTRCCPKDSHLYCFAERFANSGCVAIGQGGLDYGIERAKQATEIQRDAFGQDDIRSCLFEKYWANFLLRAAHLNEASVRHKSALDFRLKVLGSGSKDVAKSLYFVAHCLYLQEKYEESG